MPRFAANLSFLFTELPFLDRFEAAAKAGFKGVEFMFPYAFAADDIRARLDAHGLEMVLFNLPPGHWDKGERGYTALPGRDDDFASAVDLALRYAETLNCPKLHALAGLTDHGARRDTYIANLKLAAQWAAPSGVSILIEPINTRDMPGYFLTRTADARAIIEEAGEPNLGLQFDSTIAPCRKVKSMRSIATRRRTPSTNSAPSCATISVRTLRTAANPI